MNSLQLYRQGVATVVIPIDEQTQFFDECMGRFDIQCQFYSPAVLDIRVDDYIIYNGVRFTINVPYQITRDAVIQYNITFEHPSYWLKDIIFRNLGAVEFSFFGTPKMVVQLIVDCFTITRKPVLKLKLFSYFLKCSFTAVALIIRKELDSFLFYNFEGPDKPSTIIDIHTINNQHNKAGRGTDKYQF